MGLNRNSRESRRAQTENAVPVADQNQDVKVAAMEDNSAAEIYVPEVKISARIKDAKRARQWRGYIASGKMTQALLLDLLKDIGIEDNEGPWRQVQNYQRDGKTITEISKSLFYIYSELNREYDSRYGIGLVNSMWEDADNYFRTFEAEERHFANQSIKLVGAVEDGVVKGNGTIAVSAPKTKTVNKDGIELIDISQLGPPKEKEEFVFEIKPSKVKQRNPHIDMMKKAYEELPFATARFYSDRLLGEHAGLSATEIQSKYKYSLAEYNAIVKELENYNN